MRYAPTETPVCPICIAQSNNPPVTKTCKKCSVEYCVHYASTMLEHDYCGNCFTDDVKVEVYQKRDYKNIKMSGSDLYFAQETVHRMSDEALSIKVDLFDNMLTLMRLEIAERKVERQARQAKVKLIAKPAPATIPTAPKQKKAAGKPDLNAILTQLLGHVPSQQELVDFIMQAGKKEIN